MAGHWFVRFTLLSNSFNVKAKRGLVPDRLMRGDLPEDPMYDSVSQAVHRTLLHPLIHNYGTRLIAAFSDMNLLDRINKEYRTSAVDRMLFASGRKLILVHNSGVKFMDETRLKAPSFFHTFSAKVGCSTQVHILEQRIARKSGIMVVVFPTVPTEVQLTWLVKEITGLVSEKKLTGKWMVTQPVDYETQSEGPLFRADGLLNGRQCDKLFHGAVLFSQKEGTGQRNVKQSVSVNATIHHLPLRPSDRPRTIVLLLRQSSSAEADLIAGQLWRIIERFPVELLPLRPADRVIIICEYCSSSVHSILDRKLLSTHVLEARTPNIILTSVSSRMTRRVEELPLINQKLSRSNSLWFTLTHKKSKVRSQSLGATWVESAASTDTVKEELLHGKLENNTRYPPY